MSAAPSRRVFTGLNLDNLVRPDECDRASIRGPVRGQYSRPPRFPLRQSVLGGLTKSPRGNFDTSDSSHRPRLPQSDPWFNLNPAQSLSQGKRWTQPTQRTVTSPAILHSNVPVTPPIASIPQRVMDSNEEEDWDPMEWLLPPMSAATDDGVSPEVAGDRGANGSLGTIVEDAAPPPIPARHLLSVAPVLSSPVGPSSKRATVSTLPLELLGLIFSFSELGTLARAPLVCSRWNSAVRLDCSWHGLALALVGFNSTVKGARLAVREKLLAHSAEMEVDLRRAEDLHQRTLNRMDQRTAELRTRFQQAEISEPLMEDQARANQEARRQREEREEERLESELLSHCAALLDRLEATSTVLQSTTGQWYELESHRRREESEMHRIESMVDLMEREFYSTTSTSKGMTEVRPGQPAPSSASFSFSVQALESRVVLAVLVSCGFRPHSAYTDGKVQWDDPWSLAVIGCRTVAEVEILLQHVRGYRSASRPASAARSGIPHRMTPHSPSATGLGLGLSEGMIRLLIQWRKLRPSLEWFMAAAASSSTCISTGTRSSLEYLWMKSCSEPLLDEVSALRLLKALEEVNRT
jgi:hypothetical protein